MISRIILSLVVITIVLSSCSTAYKTQTPDDVYYSPPKQADSYVRTETEKERNAYRAEEEDYADDRWLRWRVRNRTRWSAFDDYDYYAYDYRYANTFSYYNWNRNNYWNYWSWNRNYNPYCGTVIVVNPKNPVAYNQVRNYVPGTYKTPAYSNRNTPVRTKAGSSGVYRPSGNYNNSNSSSLGNSIKKVFGNSGSSNNNSNYNNNNSSDRPTRTYTPSSSNSSSSGSSSSGSSGGSSGGSVTRPSRGG